MIRLNKGAEPDVLAREGPNWTRELLSHIANGTEPPNSLLRRYNHPEIKKALLGETRGKCAYCEVKFQASSYGDIEHITPKADAPKLRFNWINLTIACDVCNTNKGATAYNLIVDPYNDEPDAHVRFAGTLMFHVPSSQKGQSTVTILDLNRPHLIESRLNRLRYIQLSLQNIALAPDDRTRGILLHDFQRELESSSEFSAMVISYHREATR